MTNRMMTLFFLLWAVCAYAEDAVERVRSSVSNTVLSMPEGRRRTPEYMREFGFPLRHQPAYRGLVEQVSNNQEVVRANFGECATNMLARMVLLSAWWGGDDEFYMSGLSNCLELAMSGIVTREEFDWYRNGHRNARRGNILALKYDDPGMSNFILRVYGYTGETNVCQRILSGLARASITNFLQEVSHVK